MSTSSPPQESPKRRRSGPGAPDLGPATTALDTLDRLAVEVRRELAQLRHDCVEEAARYQDTRCSELQEANEQLVRATMDAEHRAEVALAELKEVTRSGQFDALTGTPNRALMRDRLSEALLMARRHDSCLALLYLDLDGFKQVNDTAGHAAGDEVLKQVAHRLSNAVRESDTVSRRGGDEFLVLLPEVTDRRDASRIAQKILDAVAEPMSVEEHAFNLSVSVGIALYPDDGDNPALLIDRADAAMYDAKRGGRNTFRFAAASPPTEAERPGRLPVLSSRELMLRDLRDVNEQLLMTALRAQDLLDAAELARKQQVDAMTVLAHELRNPLAPIRSTGQLLATRSDDPQIARAAEVIDRQVAQLGRLIEDLLDGSRAGARGFSLQRLKVSLRDVLERAIAANRSALLSRQQVLVVPPVLPHVMLLADPMRLEQVFSNLLDNASKYTPANGHVLVGVKREGDWVTITVSDDGVGITAQALPHIFELFTQESRSLDHRSGGMGIGLAVVNELVLAHGGRVAARSRGPDLGSTFEVSLPCADAAGECAPAG